MLRIIELDLSEKVMDRTETLTKAVDLLFSYAFLCPFSIIKTWSTMQLLGMVSSLPLGSSKIPKEHFVAIAGIRGL